MADVLDDIIILRSVFGKVGQKYFMNPVRDPKTGRFPDCVRPVDSKGDMIISDKDRNEGKPLIPENKVFIIEDGTTFNLNDECILWKLRCRDIGFYKCQWICNSPVHK